MSAIEQVTSSMAAVSLSNGRRDSKVIMLCRDRKEADVLLVCRDGTEIYMDNDTALMSKYLNQIIFLFRRCYGNGSDNDRVKVDLSKLEELANIPSYLVEKVFRYCNRHAHSQSHRDLAAVDAQFYNNVSYSEFCKLHKTATRFEIRCLEMLGIVAFKNITGECLSFHYADLSSLPF